MDLVFSDFESFHRHLKQCVYSEYLATTNRITTFYEPVPLEA